GQDALRLGQADPDEPPVASQELRPVRKYSGLSRLAALAAKQARHFLSRRNGSDVLHGLELSRLRYRQYRKPGRRIPAQFPSGLCFRQSAGVRSGALLSAGPLRNELRQLQGSARLSDPLGEAARKRQEDPG